MDARGIHRRIQFEVTDSLSSRFWAKVDKVADEQCWMWTGAVRNGYGCIKHCGNVLSAHRVSAAIHGIEIPDGMLVLHSCDVRLCVNPRHISAGTPRQNVIEAYERLDVQHRYGEGCVNASITDNIARQVLALKLVHGIGARLIARTLGISRHVAKRVLLGHCWAHVSMPTTEEAEALLDGVCIARRRRRCHVTQKQ